VKRCSSQHDFREYLLEVIQFRSRIELAKQIHIPTKKAITDKMNLDANKVSLVR